MRAAAAVLVVGLADMAQALPGLEVGRPLPVAPVCPDSACAPATIVEGAPTVRDAEGSAVAPPVAPDPTTNFQGLWWAAPAGSESGWGINFAHQGDTIFATWFTYDASGKPWWLIAVLQKTGLGTFSGDVSSVTGPAFGAIGWDATKVKESVVGTMQLAFTTGGDGTLAYTVNAAQQTKAITRQAFGPLPTCVWGAEPDLTKATNYQDLWWNEPAGSESGWGVNFAHQGDTIFATWFTYDAAGQPWWLIASLQKTGAGVYAGPVSTTTGPAFNAVPFDPARVSERVVGNASVNFANGNRASFTATVTGFTQTKAITRQVFVAPGTVCTSSGDSGPIDGTASPDIKAKLQDALDKALASAKTKPPGATLFVATASAQYALASGKANLVTATAMKPEDMLRIASMTKTYLATVVLKLAEEGKLKLDDAIARHLPDVAARIDNGQMATIRNLLAMSSGIYEYYDNDAYIAAVQMRPVRQAWTADEIISGYVYDHSGYFNPGSQFKYTNSNSLLLEMIVNKVSGSTLAAEMRRIIFTPLAIGGTFMEMKETRAGGFGGLLVRGYSTSQSPAKDITEQNDALGLGDGGLISDAQSVSSFLRALFRQKSILTEASLAQMKIVGIAGKDYGLGLEVRTSSTSGTSWGHSGKSAGFQSDMRYYPDKDVAIVILTNEENSDSDLIEVIAKGALGVL